MNSYLLFVVPNNKGKDTKYNVSSWLLSMSYIYLKL